MTSTRYRSYSRIYLADFSLAVATFFERVADKRVDCIGTEEVLLRSRAFREILERANPRYLNMGSWQLLDCVEHDEEFDWKHSKRKKKYDSEIMWWVGCLLAHFQWAYRIDFNDWLEYESIEEIYDIYYPLHEASFEVAASKIMCRYWRKKIAHSSAETLEKNKTELRKLIEIYPDLYSDAGFLTDEAPHNQKHNFMLMYSVPFYANIIKLWKML